jgi:hypothetical protein
VLSKLPGIWSSHLLTRTPACSHHTGGISPATTTRKASCTSMVLWSPNAGRRRKEVHIRCPALWVSSQLLDRRLKLRPCETHCDVSICRDSMALPEPRRFHSLQASVFSLGLSTVWIPTVVNAQAAKSFRLNPLTNFCSRWCEWRQFITCSVTRHRL